MSSKHVLGFANKTCRHTVQELGFQVVSSVSFDSVIEIAGIYAHLAPIHVPSAQIRAITTSLTVPFFHGSRHLPKPA